MYATRFLLTLIVLSGLCVSAVQAQWLDFATVIPEDQLIGTWPPGLAYSGTVVVTRTNPVNGNPCPPPIIDDPCTVDVGIRPSNIGPPTHTLSPDFFNFPLVANASDGMMHLFATPYNDSGDTYHVTIDFSTMCASSTNSILPAGALIVVGDLDIHENYRNVRATSATGAVLATPWLSSPLDYFDMTTNDNCPDISTPTITPVGATDYDLFGIDGQCDIGLWLFRTTQDIQTLSFDMERDVSGAVIGGGGAGWGFYSDPAPPPPPCDDCCGKRPNFLFAHDADFAGSVAVITQQYNDGMNGHVVDMIDIGSPQPSVGPGAPWSAIFFDPAVQLNPAQNWSQAYLGTVFGVTLDDQGNVYVAHSSAYGRFLAPGGPADVIGTIPGGSAGAIYKIDTDSGAPTVFANLPNGQLIGCTGPLPPAPLDCWPGLGNLCFSCVHQNFYVTNHEDGRIYRLDTTGETRSTWKHATGEVAAGGAADPTDVPGFAPLTAINSGMFPTRGQRVWAVRVNRGRLYYSVWRENYGQFFSGDSSHIDPQYSNEIWSIALESGANIGEFISGSERKELDMPSYANAPVGPWSNPVSDISFKPNTCCMLLAERSMANDTKSDAHASRLLEYCEQDCGWVLSMNFDTGGFYRRSSAGGCDYDFATDPGTRVNVWETADHMDWSDPYESYNAYGIGGMPFDVGDPLLNGLYVDSDLDPYSEDKTQQGSVKITCPTTPCLEFTSESIFCKCPSPGYTYKLTLKNNATVRVRQIEITNATVTPAGAVAVTLVTPLQPLVTAIQPQRTRPITLKIEGDGALPNAEVCFDIKLYTDVSGQDQGPICVTRQCVTLPSWPCECLQLRNVEVTCSPVPEPNSYQLSFNIENLTQCTFKHLFLLDPATTNAATFSPNVFTLKYPDPNRIGRPGQVFTLPFLPPCQTSTTITTIVTVPQGAGEFQFELIPHTDVAGCNCCTASYSITLPEWTNPGYCCFECYVPITCPGCDPVPLGTYTSLPVCSPADCAALFQGNGVFSPTPCTPVCNPFPF